MEALAEELSSSMKRESRFFVRTETSEIHILTQLLDDLNRFLQGADAKSVEKLMRASVKGWLEQTEEKSEEFDGFSEENCLLKLSKILQEGRIVNFLSRAGRRFSKLNAIRNQATVALYKEDEGTTRRTGKLFYSVINDFVDSATKDVIEWLIDEEPERSVHSLVGPIAIGKTDLARKAYESEMVRGHFDCCCWVNVSMSYNIPGVLKFIIKQIAQQSQQDFGEIGKLRTMQLFSTLRQALQPKRYMLVFSDVFHEGFWHVMKQALPDNKKGSRIIVTTTSDTVVESCKGGSFDRVYRLEPLSDAMSWELFSGIAFSDEPEMRCPTELEPLSREIIRTCKGFPLPILGIAGLLSKKERLVSEWQKLYENFRLEMRMNPHPPGVAKVLALSYQDLPEHLTPCFLYLSVFPNDSFIPNDKLFKLWIAEGFIEEKIGMTLEEIAEDYLNELILRGLVQPCQGVYGLDQFCHVNRLIQNFARMKADETNFCRIWDDMNHSSNKKSSSRLSICDTVYIAQADIDSQIRSIFLFNSSLLSSSIGSTIIAKCSGLTMLDFENYPIGNVPEELGNLVHLKYLSLKNTKVRKLPESLQKLQSLETLDVRNTLIIELPTEINNLKNLRHLLATDSTNRTVGDSIQGVMIKEGIGEPQNLHTLITLEAHKSGIGIIKQLAKLKELRALAVSGLTEETCTALCTCVNEFGHLKSLTLQARNSSEALNLESITTQLPLLRRLVLKGTLVQLPEWIIHLRNLNTLCLSLSRLTEDPLIHLSHLPNLESLWLYKAFEGEQLYFEDGGFKKLKLLDVRELHGLNVFEIEDGALPSLEELRIGSIRFLDKVPSGIQYLRNLNVLASYDMPNDYVGGLLPYEGKDYWKVKHIPSVTFLYRVRGRDYKSFELRDSEFWDHFWDHLLGLPTDGSYHISKCPVEYELSFCESDDDDDDDDDDDNDDENVGQLSFTTNHSDVSQKNTSRMSFSSSFYTDDFEQ